MTDYRFKLRDLGSTMDPDGNVVHVNMVLLDRDGREATDEAVFQAFADLEDCSGISVKAAVDPAAAGLPMFGVIAATDAESVTLDGHDGKVYVMPREDFRQLYRLD